ncbi:hypothetical protein HMPREF1550_00195 [Actinomyces sp. oral taxon 877 str. F0543]|nr:hypothetical protein HMPREF1550_00195 [Actinomyces sp. oral taxon 877 str. F0543]
MIASGRAAVIGAKNASTFSALRTLLGWLCFFFRASMVVVAMTPLLSL